MDISSTKTRRDEILQVADATLVDTLLLADADFLVLGLDVRLPGKGNSNSHGARLVY